MNENRKERVKSNLENKNLKTSPLDKDSYKSPLLKHYQSSNKRIMKSRLSPTKISPSNKDLDILYITRSTKNLNSSIKENKYQ